jgi:hypothetical protein
VQVAFYSTLIVYFIGTSFFLSHLPILSKFRVELTKNVITIKGKAGKKNLNLEFLPQNNSNDITKTMFVEWYNSLSVCVERANGRKF